ncbi:MAG: hypothetical protein IKN55_12510 [Oscillospiraceae bacterium]|nr:hypothetical protein [Oscillospiraceae bacterium]
MKLKPKGRKIYRQKSRFERLRAFGSNTGAIVFTLLLIAVLGFVGYSAGGPVLRFLQDRQIIAKPSAPSETSAVSPSEPTQHESGTGEQTEASVAAETQPEPSEAPSEAIVIEPKEQPVIRGYQIPAAALSTKDALEKALQQVPEDATHILIPLKVKGGGLYYATTLADGAKAVQAAMPLASIYDTVRIHGAEPVAVINTLEDQIYPLNYQDASYQISGSGARWTDPSGAVWMAPYSGLTVDYLSNIAKEADDAGFRSIICEGLVFPEFPEKDIHTLDPRSTDPERYTSIVKLVESMQASAPDADFYIRIGGLEVLANRKDAVTAADHLDINALLIGINSVTKESAELLRGISQTHPSVFSCDDTDVPGGEENYVIVMKPEVKTEAVSTAG